MQDDADSTGLSVLIVEDCRDTAVTLALLLRLWGHRVEVAFDGPAALDVAGHFQPDVVLLDIGLPLMDGYQVARRLRGDMGLSGAVIATLSGYAEERDHQRSRQAGCDAHLVKPVEPDVLKVLLSMWATRAGPWDKATWEGAP
jgi:two-component system CheB/CheR fusion protein